MAVVKDNTLAQAFRFAVVGLSGVVVNMAVLGLCYGRLHWPLVSGVVCAAEVAMLNNYVWNEQWTFGQPHVSPGRFAQFNLSSLGGLAVATAITVTLVRAGSPYMSANVVGIATGSVCNFAASKLWIWRLIP